MKKSKYKLELLSTWSGKENNVVQRQIEVHSGWPARTLQVVVDGDFQDLIDLLTDECLILIVY